MKQDNGVSRHPLNSTNLYVSLEHKTFVDNSCYYAHAGMYDAGEYTYVVMGLNGEAGEVTEVMKKVVRDTGFDDQRGFRETLANPRVSLNLLHEVGDVLWYLQRMCTLLECTIEELMITNSYKLFRRLVKNGRVENLVWPHNSISLEDASKLTRRIESLITDRSVSICTDIDTSSKQPSKDQ